MILYRYQQIVNSTPLDTSLDKTDVIIFSAEVNWKFRIKILGLEHLNLIFRELETASKPGDQRVATNNGEAFPRNLTNAYDKKEYKEQSKETKKFLKKKHKDEKKLKQCVSSEVSTVIFKAKREHDSDRGDRIMRPTLTYPYDYPFINLANNYQYLKPLERFKLIVRGHKKVNYFNFFVPYMLQVEVQLIHGCEVLATSSTKSIPFSYAPRFNQWLTMKIQEGIP